MVRINDHTISLGTLLAMIALAGTGVGAWVDVKSDVSSLSTKTEEQTKSEERLHNRLSRMEDKLDRLIERELKDD